MVGRSVARLTVYWAFPSRPKTRDAKTWTTEETSDFVRPILDRWFQTLDAGREILLQGRFFFHDKSHTGVVVRERQKEQRILKKKLFKS